MVNKLLQNKEYIKYFLMGAVSSFVVIFLSIIVFEEKTDREKYSSVEEYVDENIPTIDFPYSETDLEREDVEKIWSTLVQIRKKFVPAPTEFETTGDNAVYKRLYKQRNPTKDEFIEGAINGLTFSTKDPYTSYFNEKKAKDFESETIDGEITGIGAFLEYENEIISVVKPIEGGPAYKAGLKAGDKILSINDESTSLFTFSEAVDRIKGKKGTEVSLYIYRPIIKKNMEIKIIRDLIEIPSIETEIKDGVFILKIFNFSEKTKSSFKKGMMEFLEYRNKTGNNNFILDLRGNSGGLLSKAEYIAGAFLEVGDIIYFEYNGTKRIKAYKNNFRLLGEEKNPNIVILVDSISASASEIVAAALLDNDVAEIVGTNTAGKGSIQALIEQKDGAILKLTIAHWLTPKKRTVGIVGIEPTIDLEEEILSEIKDDEEFDIDAFMLDKAIEHIRNKF